ncbi:MAG: nucleotidyltransferase family protein [Corallococcus sp.]|nr:nucleotidyltransferase family protein [Corallococcus sp.]
MKICAIIAEFNPLHYGHKRLIDFSKSQSDTVCCIMSGNFTQRAFPAIADKYQRAEHAIRAGADLVIELPTLYATSSAENFAYGAIQIAKEINCDTLCFGSECGDSELLMQCANTLLNAKDNTAIKQNLKHGMSYPSAVAKSFPQYRELLSQPNNTLAIEYINAATLLQAKMNFITIKRPANYNSCDIGEYPSSKALRETLKNSVNSISEYVPPYVSETLNTGIELSYKSFAHKAMSLSNRDYLNKIEGVTEGLENRICKYCDIGSWDKFINAVKCKRYTQMKIQRIVFNAIMSITKNAVQQSKACTPVINILAVRDGKQQLLQLASKTTKNTFATELDDKANKFYAALSGNIINKRLRIVEE